MKKKMKKKKKSTVGRVAFIFFLMIVGFFFLLVCVKFVQVITTFPPHPLCVKFVQIIITPAKCIFSSPVHKNRKSYCTTPHIGGSGGVGVGGSVGISRLLKFYVKVFFM